MFVFNLGNFKSLLFYIAIPVLAGFVGYLLGCNTQLYSYIVKPNFSPPASIFPIVWTILYFLMGISSYIISTYTNNEKALRIFYFQLIVNTIWSLLFFRFNLFLLSALWIVFLIIIVIYMIYLFYKIDKRAALLQIPYLIWLTFACILNFTIFFLNR